MNCSKAETSYYYILLQKIIDSQLICLKNFDITLIAGSCKMQNLTTYAHLKEMLFGQVVWSALHKLRQDDAKQCSRAISEHKAERPGLSVRVFPANIEY